MRSRARAFSRDGKVSVWSVEGAGGVGSGLGFEATCHESLEVCIWRTRGAADVVIGMNSVGFESARA